jgi:hypothetical protein
LKNDKKTELGDHAEGGDFASFLAGGGEMGALLRAHRWADSPLGAPERWPRSLKTAIRIMLTSRQPIWVGWGTDLLFAGTRSWPEVCAKAAAALGSDDEEINLVHKPFDSETLDSALRTAAERRGIPCTKAV